MSKKILNKYDVVIIGCGVAGATAGALLTEREGKKVLVLERASKIGGRTVSFRGEGIQDGQDYQKVLGMAANTWYSTRSQPDLSELVKKGALNGYVIEAGGRAGWFTNRGRVSYVLAAFNKASIFYPNVGFVNFDHDWKAYNVVRGVRYGWMRHDDYAETKKIARRLMSTPNIEAAEEFDRISLKDWIAEITSNPLATEFYSNIGTFHTVLNDPALISAGENMKVVVMAREAGVHVTNGAWSFAGSPGHRFIVECLADVINDNGGQIVTEAKVSEILIKNDRVAGVVVEIGGEVREIMAPVVICTAPPKAMIRLVPERLLPDDFKNAVERTINAGVVSAAIGLNKSLMEFSQIEMDRRSFFAAPILVHEKEGFRGHVPIVGCSLSDIAPTQAPEGKHLGMLISNVLSNEAHDKAKVDRVIDRMMEFMDTAFPGYKKAMEWIIFTVTETALCWRRPEDKKLDTKCPDIEGLYFAGDSYGYRCNSGGIDAAAHSGIVCAGAVAGKSFLEILPPIMR